MVVHKHELCVGRNNLEIGIFGEPLCIGFQDNKLFLWEMHPWLEPTEKQEIVVDVVMTGEAFSGIPISYIGTATNNGIVVHAFLPRLSA